MTTLIEHLPPLFSTGKSDIVVDEEGNWFFRGSPIVREDILQLFYDHLRLSPEGHYLIEWQGSVYPIEVADTPFVVGRVDAEGGEDFPHTLWLTLRHIPQPERLEPDTLFVGRAHVLYCVIRNGTVPARFSRPAYYQIVRWIDENSGGYVLSLHGNTFPIRVPSSDGEGT